MTSQMAWRLGTHEALTYFRAMTDSENKTVKAFPIVDTILIYLD